MRTFSAGLWRGLLSLLAATVMAGALAACGDSSIDDASSSSDANTTAQSTTTSDADQGVSAAQEFTDKLTAAPSGTGVSEPLSGSVKGKQVVFVECLAPICAAIGQYTAEGLEALGVSTKIISAGATPSSIAQAFSAAVSSNPDALIESSIPTAVWAPQLAQLEKKGIPVIVNATLADPAGGVSAEFYPADQSAYVGKALANRVIADTEGEGKSVYVFTPEFPGLVPQVDEYFATLKAECPNCSAERLNVKAADVGRVIPNQVTSYLQAHPDVRYVIAQYGNLLTGVPAALKAAGIDGVKLISSGGDKVNYEYIKAGQQEADLSLYLDVFGWQIADTTARLMLGEKADVPPIPASWITQDNATFDFSRQPPFDGDYQAEFKGLWGVG